MIELCCGNRVGTSLLRHRQSTVRHLATILALVAIYTSASAQEKRVEMGWSGENGYFSRQSASINRAFRSYISDVRQQEFLRAETDNCADVPACKEMKVEVSQEPLGAPFGKRIFQVNYTFVGEPLSKQMSQPYWKSIVIETSQGMYRELLLLKNEGGFWIWPPSTTDIVNAGMTKLLVTNDRTTSRDMECTGEFWVLAKSGATLADFSDVVRAMNEAMPRGTQNITPLCAAVDPAKLEVRGDVQKFNPQCSACGFEGHIVVKFRFEGQRAVPGSAIFTPEPE